MAMKRSNPGPSKARVDTARRTATLARARADTAKANAEAKAYRTITNSVKGGVPTRTSEPWQSVSSFQYGTTGERAQITSARDRAYNAYDNNPVAQTLIDTECDHVIGDGLNYQPTTDDEAWNREAEDKYYEWLETASVRGLDMISGCEIESELWKLSRIAGDVGWILVARGTPDALESRIQIVGAENIVTPDGMYADKRVFDGIRFDEFGAPQAFYYLNETEREPSRRFIPIPARDFVFFPHLSKSKMPRGMTSFRTIFELLAHLDRYVEGVSLAAWMATIIGLIVKSPTAGKEFNALTNLIPNAKGEWQRAVTMENGMLKYVGAEGEVLQVDAKQPMQQTPEFIRTMLRMLGQPFGMPLEVIAKDMSTCNFASARIGLLPFYRSCRKKAARFGYRWSRTIKWWLAREAQRSDADPNKWTTAFPKNYWAHELLPNAFEYTDPVSDAQSDQLQVDMGSKSIPMVIAERGRNKAKIAREQREWLEDTADLPHVRSNMTRDPPAEAGADPNAVDPELERIKAEADAYGVAVRAGAVTPQTDDEKAFRQKLSLPAMSDAANKAWDKDEWARRPITLAPPPGTEPASPFPGRTPAPDTDEPTEDNNGQSTVDSNGDRVRAD